MEKPQNKEADRATDTSHQPTGGINDIPESPGQSPNRAATSSRRRKIVIAALIAVVVFFLAGFAGTRLYQAAETNDNSIADRPTVENDGNRIVTQEEENIANVVSEVSPSVVSIVTQSQDYSRFGIAEQAGAGTGIIVGADGYVLTNKHVVEGVDAVDVVLSNGTSYEDVEVLGADPLNDIAFLKIDGVNDLPVAELGDSTSIRVGQRVIAIGNSLGQYQNTVTSGIISGKGRPVMAQAGDSVANLTDLIQTDAAINPGNSGGPLLNLQGQVIGINTAIIEDAQGIGFAIPINATKGMLKDVLAGGPVERAYLGINFIPITPDAARRYDLPVTQGAYVFSEDRGSAVVNGSPADEAGIRDRDIITRVNDVQVGEDGGLSTLVAEYAPGDTIELTVLRGGQTVTQRVTLGTYRD